EVDGTAEAGLLRLEGEHAQRVTSRISPGREERPIIAGLESPLKGLELSESNGYCLRDVLAEGCQENPCGVPLALLGGRYHSRLISRIRSFLEGGGSCRNSGQITDPT